jgi:hypothetical protein
MKLRLIAEKDPETAPPMLNKDLSYAKESQMKCYFKDCQNDDTKPVHRYVGENEQTKMSTDQGVSIAAIAEVWVCKEHEEEARKTYPYQSNH